MHAAMQRLSKTLSPVCCKRKQQNATIDTVESQAASAAANILWILNKHNRRNTAQPSASNSQEPQALPHGSALKRAGGMQLRASNMAACRVILFSVKFSMIGLPVGCVWISAVRNQKTPHRHWLPVSTTTVQTMLLPHSIDDEDERYQSRKDIFGEPQDFFWDKGWKAGRCQL